MDIVDECKAMIKEGLEELGVGGQSENAECEPDPSTQAIVESYTVAQQDRNLDKILNQQGHLKRIIDQDNNLQILKSSLTRVALEIDGLRRACTKQNEDALRARQELAQAQAKELEKYQMNQIRSISEDYDRHQEILETRKKEIVTLQRETEREINERSSYLADVEKKLEKQLQDRQRSMRGGASTFSQAPNNSAGGLDDEITNPDHIELTSVEEYAPYGAAPHSRMPSAPRGGRGGRGRGRRRGRA